MAVIARRQEIPRLAGQSPDKRLCPSLTVSRWRLSVRQAWLIECVEYYLHVFLGPPPSAKQQITAKNKAKRYSTLRMLTSSKRARVR